MRPPSSQDQARSQARNTAWLLAAALVVAVMVLLPPKPGGASGPGSPAECLSPDARVTGLPAVTHSAPSGQEIEYVCVKGLFGHLKPITADGVYGKGVAQGCYAVDGVGTSHVTIGRASQSLLCRITGFVDRYVGHVDVFHRAVTVPNAAPQVSAGDDATIAESESAALDGTASDDGLPNPPGALVTAWSKVDGPGDVSFGDASSVETAATFSEPGTYVLRLSASDGALEAFDLLQVTVEEGSPAPDLVPSALTETGATDLGKATEFLYSGPGAVQTGVEPGAIARERAAVVHGIVRHRDTGAVLPGALCASWTTRNGAKRSLVRTGASTWL